MLFPCGAAIAPWIEPELFVKKNKKKNKKQKKKRGNPKLLLQARPHVDFKVTILPLFCHYSVALRSGSSDSLPMRA